MTMTPQSWNLEIIKEYIPNIVVLALYFILGISGNVLVLLVYKKKLKKHSEDRYFIPILAVSDLVSCTICTVRGFTKIFMAVTFYNAALCLTLAYLASATVYMTIFLLSIIAIHRYLKVCRPFSTQMTLKVKRGLVFVAVCVAFIFASPILVVFGTKTVTHPVHQSNVTGSKCCFMSEKEPTWSIMYILTEAIVIFGSFVMIMVLYGLIAKTVYTHLNPLSIAKSRQSIANITETSTEICTQQDGELSPNKCKDTAQIVQSSSPKETNRTSPGSQSSRFSFFTGNMGIRKSTANIYNKRILNKENSDVSQSEMMREKRSQKIKTKFNTIFMIMAVIFLISFIPKFLKHLLQYRFPDFMSDFNVATQSWLVILFDLHFLNHICNPFLYAFADSKFRRELTSLLTCKT